MTKRRVDLPSRGVSLYVRTCGSGRPILLMHGGLGLDHTTLLPITKCRDSFVLILYDHRCNGRSTGADLSSLTWENLAEDAEALRERLGIGQWAVLGHAFGGMIALEYALRFPQSLTHLILMDTGADAALVHSIIAAEDDFQFLPEHQREMAKALPNARYHSIQKASHNPLVERPTETMELIRDFVK